MSDLESSVHKRDRIIDAVISKEKTPRDEGSNKSQRLMTQKIEMIESKNKTLQKVNIIIYTYLTFERNFL